jgi:hypothetical protein
MTEPQYVNANRVRAGIEHAQIYLEAAQRGCDDLRSALSRNDEQADLDIEMWADVIATNVGATDAVLMDLKKAVEPDARVVTGEPGS